MSRRSMIGDIAIWREQENDEWNPMNFLGVGHLDFKFS